MKSGRGLFEGIVQKPIAIRHWSSLSPLFYRDLSMMQGIFLADIDAARAMMPSARLRPTPGLPGKALVAINCFEYRDTDVGPYNEVGISVAVQVNDRTPGPIAMLRSRLTRRYHGHVLELPVNTEIALAGGLDYFNYPKYLAKIVFVDEEKWRTCSVSDRETGKTIFSIRARRTATKMRKPGRDANPSVYFSYPLKDGQLLKARLLMDVLERGGGLAGSGFEYHAGDHPRAHSLRALRLGRLLEYVYAPRCQAVLFEPEPV